MHQRTYLPQSVSKVNTLPKKGIAGKNQTCILTKAKKNAENNSQLKKNGTTEKSKISHPLQYTIRKKVDSFSKPTYDTVPQHMMIVLLNSPKLTDKNSYRYKQ